MKRKYKNIKIAMDQASASFGLRYDKKANIVKIPNTIGQNTFRLIGGELIGTYKRKEVKVCNLSRTQGKGGPRPFTYYHVSLQNQYPNVILGRKGFGTNFMKKYLGLKVVDLNENYYLIANYSSPANFQKDTQNIYGKISPLLTERVLAAFYALPGYNQLMIHNGNLIVLHPGFSISFDEIQQFLSFLTEVERRTSY